MTDRAVFNAHSDLPFRVVREAGLLTERTRSTIQDVCEASMAMLGGTVFAMGTGLTDIGYDPTVTATSAAGATLL